MQEKLTSERVKAIRKIDSRPVVAEALESTLLPHDDGRASSNIPKKLRAKTTKRRKKKILNGAFVDISLSVCGPKSAVMTSARVIYIIMMDIP